MAGELAEVIVGFTVMLMVPGNLREAGGLDSIADCCLLLSRAPAAPPSRGLSLLRPPLLTQSCARVPCAPLVASMSP